MSYGRTFPDLWRRRKPNTSDKILPRHEAWPTCPFRQATKVRSGPSPCHRSRPGSESPRRARSCWAAPANE